MMGIWLVVLWSANAADTKMKSVECVDDNSTTNGTIYTFSEIELNERNKNFTLSLNRYRGKVLLIVNVCLNFLSISGFPICSF